MRLCVGVVSFEDKSKVIAANGRAHPVHDLEAVSKVFVVSFSISSIHHLRPLLNSSLELN